MTEMIVVARREAQGGGLDIEPLAAGLLPAHEEMLAGLHQIQGVAQSPSDRDIQDRHGDAGAA